MNKTKKNRKSYKKKRFNKKSINFKNNKSRYNKKSKKKYLKGGRTPLEFFADGVFGPASLTSNITIVVTNHFKNATESTRDYDDWLDNRLPDNKYNLLYILSHPEIDDFLQVLTKTFLIYRDTPINTQNNLPIPRKDPNNIQRVDEEICDFLFHILSEIIEPIKKFFTEKKSNLHMLMDINELIKNIFDKAKWLLWFGIGRQQLEEIKRKSNVIRSVINSYCSMIRFLCIYDINAHRYSFSPYSNNYFIQKFSQGTSRFIPSLIFSTLIPKIVAEINRAGYNDFLKIKSAITSNTPIGKTINITKNIIATIPSIKNLFNKTAITIYGKVKSLQNEHQEQLQKEIQKEIQNEKQPEIVNEENADKFSENERVDDVNQKNTEEFADLKSIEKFVSYELTKLYYEVYTAERFCKQFTGNCDV